MGDVGVGSDQALNEVMVVLEVRLGTAAAWKACVSDKSRRTVEMTRRADCFMFGD
jgi:hypothetical protein